MSEVDIAVKMAAILGTCVAGLAGLCMLQQAAVKEDPTRGNKSSFLPDPVTEPSKRAYEIFVAAYTPVWIGAMAVIVAGRLYEDFTPVGYNVVCAGLALPFLLQPVIIPGAFQQSPDAARPLVERYAFKANIWIAVYSFIGNYWYTHYFYSVLRASYTVPNAIRLNNVPAFVFFATHFYFSTYHFFSNCLLRKVVTTYSKTLARDALFCSVIAVFAYFTAFMETLSISAYPYWTFSDRNLAYTVGSAFYGIYFLVSFPAFYFFDSCIDVDDAKNNRQEGRQKKKAALSLWETIVQACGYGMMILLLLDFVRLWLGIPLVVGAARGDGAHHE